MRSTRLLILGILSLSLVPCSLQAQPLEFEHTARTGMDSVPAEFFRKWYHRSDLIYYLEALNDHSIIETPSYGQWSEPERLMLAIEGLPCTSNRFYIDGFRVDDRFQPGSTVYLPNMQRYDLLTNTHTSQLYFTLDTLVGDYVQVNGNTGQLGSGEPMPGTKQVFNITHRSPMESADTYKHVSARRHLRGAGRLDAAYTFHDRDSNAYRQHLYASYGQRMLTRENESGLILEDPFYTTYYYKVQADGTFPIQSPNARHQLGYRLNFSGRGDAGSEYLYNYGEVYDLRNYTASAYYKYLTDVDNLTTGITWATNTTHHDNLGFAKNLIDQDGESFFPWVADGKTHEMSWAVNYHRQLLPWLELHVDAYNSLVHFSPEQTSWSNTIYFQRPIDYSVSPALSYAPFDLYRYDWQSRAFTGGLLENTVGLSAHYAACPVLDINAHLDLTLDGLLLSNKSKVSLGFQAGFNLDIHPCRWFEMGATFSYERMPYTMDHLRYMSDDYMNAEIHDVNTGTLLATTGGRYHQYKKGLPQTTYFEFDLPLRFRFGRHEIVLQQSYKKFFNVWYTSFLGSPDDYGYYLQQNGLDVYYQYPGVKQYEICTSPAFAFDEANRGAALGFIRTSPYYFSQLTRYTYTGRKVTVSVGWQSMQAAGFSGLGNGANSNSLGALSESTANPNTQNVVFDQGAASPGVGRLDLDKGYVCRFYLGYNICEWVQLGATIKWTDGKPFSAYRYYQDGTQYAILPENSRGTNPTDQHFGTRHCAKYNIDLHMQGHWTVNNTPMTLKLECYNIWDFCHDLAEMSFVQDIPYANRASMIMDIPTGLLATFTVDLP